LLFPGSRSAGTLGSTSGTASSTQAPFASPAERHTRAVEWGALLERRRRAGERALADAREAEERRRALERWTEEWGLPPGRGVPVCWVADGQSDKEKEVGKEKAKGETGNHDGGQKAQEGGREGEKGGDGDGDVEMPGRQAAGDGDGPAEAHAQAQAQTEEEDGDGEDGAGGYAPEDAYAEDDYGRMRRRSPLCIVSSVPASLVPPSPLVLSPEQSPSVDGQAPQHPELESHAQEQEEGGPRTDLVYEAPQVLSPYSNGQQQQQQEDDLGPDPATRMNTGWGPWKIACRMRVWDV
jgi:hypothetical protein